MYMLIRLIMSILLVMRAISRLPRDSRIAFLGKIDKVVTYNPFITLMVVILAIVTAVHPLIIIVVAIGAAVEWAAYTVVMNKLRDLRHVEGEF